MSMSFWATFWTVTLVVGAAVFAGLAVVVAIGAAGDIRALFRSLEKQHEGTDNDE